MRLTKEEHTKLRYDICQAMKNENPIKTFPELFTLAGSDPGDKEEFDRCSAIIRTSREYVLKKIFAPKLRVKKEELIKKHISMDDDMFMDLINIIFKECIDIAEIENRPFIYKDNELGQLVIPQTFEEINEIKSNIQWKEIKGWLNTLKFQSLCNVKFLPTGKRATNLLTVSKIYFKEYLNGDFEQ